MMIEGLLRKKDVIERVGIPKSTISDWIEDFKLYIPTIKQNNIVYYRPETIKILLEVKELRNQNYSKDQIHQMLNEKGYTIQVEIEERPSNPVFQSEQNGQNEVLKYMELLGLTLSTVSEQEERLKRYEEEVSKLKIFHDKQSEQIEKQEATLQILQEELEQLKQGMSASIHKKNGGNYGKEKDLIFE
ncbi:MerR family transcriptional regulator [Bacillus mycoides]|uniref:MerR family transcriptional regulator n=2 Tax=Bacillus mycoides TaxID=1405 RepID=UPI003D045C84